VSPEEVLLHAAGSGGKYAGSLGGPPDDSEFFSGGVPESSEMEREWSLGGGGTVGEGGAKSVSAELPELDLDSEGCEPLESELCKDRN
jgi:hypothetical protein